MTAFAFLRRPVEKTPLALTSVSIMQECWLDQIEEGLKINSKIRVLHHTKGVILNQLAMTTESREIARRRLVQSEDEFRFCISNNNKDEYAYQGLATLYVEWAKRTDDSTESTEYLAKAEAVINDGLRHVRVR